VICAKSFAFYYSTEALSTVFITGVPWELLYADDLVLIAESEDELMDNLKVWKKCIDVLMSSE
jgi:hypothetical protein